MTKYAIVENGKVVNTVLADADFATDRDWIECPENAGIGWDYVNGSFVDNRPVEINVVAPDPIPSKQDLLIKLQTLQAQIAALQ